MNVEALIEQLKKYPPDTKVVIAGYEGGVREISYTGLCPIALNVNDEWYYGPHELFGELTLKSRDDFGSEIETDIAVFVS